MCKHNAVSSVSLKCVSEYLGVVVWSNERPEMELLKINNECVNNSVDVSIK